MLASENARLLELGANEQPKLHNLKIAKLESEIEAGLLREQNLHNHIKQLTSKQCCYTIIRIVICVCVCE